MNTESAVLAVEDRFFAALSEGDRQTLETIVADDCILIDVLTGAEVPGPLFVEALGSRRLVFQSIERLEAKARVYDGTTIVTGQTRLVGHFEAKSFQVHSRYTHVYARVRAGLRLVNGQGTPVVATSA
jgi:ketosteroid isomerase-like protein